MELATETSLTRTKRKPKSLHEIRLKEEASKCLHELFEAQVDLRPQAPALICNDQVLSYEELDFRSNQLARYLRRHGIGPRKFVGIYFERSAEPIIAILACLKAGVAYVPIDPAYPSDRIKNILIESDAVLLLTESSLCQRAVEYYDGLIIATDIEAKKISMEPHRRLRREESGVFARDLCYVIYTSGTTGRPKGIMTEHGHVSRFVAAFNRICKTCPSDRVFQGFSLSFDGSVEEMWMAFSNGSALMVPTRETPKFGNELGQFLAKNGVTYFSTVPTLLSTLKDLVPTLRILVVSGEICPPELVNRWAKPNLRMLNVYGPTEATVNTTVAECFPNVPVNIGYPLPGYDIHILDTDQCAVSPGEKGELFVGGKTLARGYLKQPELTSEKFCSIAGTRLYRTGDLVSLNSDGSLEFYGRMDSQVKIRGFRVELAEIESILLEHEQISSASVKLIEKDGLQELAAYVVIRGSIAHFDRIQVLTQLESRVPPYMIPGYLDVLDELPMLTSGKVDRKQLPEPALPLIRAGSKVIEANFDLEIQIAKIWEKVFKTEKVSIEDDFFLDLGGHSLVAAQMVTSLREQIGRHVTVRNAYSYPTIQKLAHYIESLPEQSSGDTAKCKARPSQTSQSVFEALPKWIRFTTATFQALSTYVFYGIGSIPFAIFILAALHWYQGDLSTWKLAGCIVLLAFLTWPLMLAISILAKWLVVGRYKAGKYPLWGFYYFRLWFSGRLQAFSGAGALVGTPWLPLYLRLMGAKVGHRCTLDTGMVGAFDLIRIGDDTSIGADTQLPGYRVEGGMIHVGRVEIGSRCFVGIHSALGLNVRMEDDSRLDDQSLLADGQAIEEGKSMRGSPAQLADVTVPEPHPISRFRRIAFGLVQLALIHLLPLLSLIPAVPFLALWIFAFWRGGLIAGAASLILSVPLGVVVTCLFIAALKKLILRKAKPGVYRVDSVFYLRKWLSDGMMKASRSILLPLYTTLYFPPWLRMLGAKIGPRAELSTVWNFAPELVDVGEESFFADGSIIGGKRIFGGRFQIGINRIGRRSFVGNGAILPVGVSLGDRCLLGVQSIPPSDSNCTEDGTEWLGSPSFALPHRIKVGGFDDTVTFRPTKKLYFQRAIIDGLRILIPGYIGLFLMVAGVIGLYFLLLQFGIVGMIALAPLLGLALSLCSVLLVVALKKGVMGTFKPVIVPLWSMYVWLNEMVNGTYESVMSPAIAPFLGTPFIAPLLRLLGCKIGRNTYIETTLFSEFDLVEIGDYAALNAGAVIQNHLFEDRIMKSSHLKIGPECSVGNMAVVLYDSEMQRGAALGPLSLLMKGETLAPYSHSYGIPTVQARSVEILEPKQEIIPIGFHVEISAKPNIIGPYHSAEAQ